MTEPTDWYLSADRFFDPDPATRRIAREVYDSIARLPIISPHGHVDPTLFASPDAAFGSPCDLLIIPDHYVTRMLHSQGIPLSALGILRRDGGPVETDHRKIWQIFAERFYLFRGTPTGSWLAYEFKEVLGISQRLTPENAGRMYDEVLEKLASPEFRPRCLYEQFNIEVLSTTDGPADPLAAHAAIRASGWSGHILPTFRPDSVVNLDTPGWPENIEALAVASGIEISGYGSFLEAIRNRRAFFQSMGAVATDHASLAVSVSPLAEFEAARIFGHACLGPVDPASAGRFTAHMLFKMAEMSAEDGLVMQIHPGSLRNYDPETYAGYGRDAGADIPVEAQFTRGLQPLLAHLGNDPRLRIILFTLDETAYARELAPLAGYFPALRLGPPWWFHDSLNGMRRYFDQVIETAGLYNTAGFNDDTRAFLSIPARHDVWRRASANWLAGLVVRGQVDTSEARQMAGDLAYGLPKEAYRLG